MDFQPDPSVDLRKYLSILRVRKLSIAVVTLVVVGSALAFSFAQTPTYMTEARVLVQPLSGSQNGVVQPVDVQTESQLVRSETVAQLVQVDLGGDLSTKSLLEGLSVQGSTAAQTLYSSNQVLILSYSAEDAVFARDAVNSFSENYIQYRQEQAMEELIAARRAVQKRVQAASDQLNDVTAELEEANQGGNAALISTLETQRSVLIARLGVLQQRLDDLQPDEAERTGGAEIIESASVPSSPSSPDFLKNTALALIVGLGLGISTAFLRERLDDRFRGRADLEETLGCPVLATVSRFPGARREKFGLVASEESKGLASEAYRSLRTNLQFTLKERGINSVVVTSPSEGEGKTTTTANLGVVLAQAGQRVILVSADLRRPSLGRYFGVGAQEGLATYLSTDNDVWDYLHDPGIANLRIIPSGPVPDNPAELLTSPKLAGLIRALEQQADLVIIDTPPVLAVADSSIVSGRAGGTILVVDAGETHRSAAAHAKEELERAGGHVLGTVLNRFDASSSPYYYAPYYYSTEYRSEGDGRAGNGKSSSKERSRPRFGFRR